MSRPLYRTSQRLRATDRPARVALNSHALTVNFIIAAGSGFLFWAAASRSSPPSSVGAASAFVSAVMAVAAVCQLNFYGGLLRFLPLARDPARLMRSAYLVTGLISAVAGVGLGLIAPHLSSDFSFVDSPAGLLLCSVSVVSWTIFSLQDCVLTAARLGYLLPFENGGFGLLRAALVIVWVGTSPQSLVLSWLAPMLILIPAVSWVAVHGIRSIQFGSGPSTSREMIRTHGTFVWLDTLAVLAFHVSTTLLPVIVITVAGADSSAVVFVALSIATVLQAPGIGGAMLLTSEGSRGGGLGPLLRHIGGRALTLTTAGVAVVMLFPRPFLALFGQHYADTGVTVLRILAVVAIPRVLIVFAVAWARVRGDGAMCAVLHGVPAVLVITITIALGSGATATELALAYLVAQAGGGALSVVYLAVQRHTSRQIVWDQVVPTSRERVAHDPILEV